MAEPVIALRDVSLTLASRAGPVEILKRVDVDIAPGESVAVVGPSGSGKTSLLMVIAGLERATSGSVRVAGHDFMAPRARTSWPLVRGSNIGIVFQSFHLVPTMTALENVALPLEFAGKADAFATRRARCWPRSAWRIAPIISRRSSRAASSSASPSPAR